MFEVMQSLLVQYSAMKSNNIKEQVSWMLECSFHLFKYSDILDGKLDRITKETKLFVLLMLTNHSYKIKHIMNFVGKPKVVNCNEIIELLEDCDSPSNRFALAARKIKKKTRTILRKRFILMVAIIALVIMLLAIAKNIRQITLTPLFLRNNQNP